MIDEKKLIEEVADLREKAQIFEDSGCATDGIVKAFREAADTIEELSAKLAINSQPPADQWIPCSLATPKPFNNVLVSYCDYSVGFMHLEYDGKWHDYDWLVVEQEEITAWMPLPEPYKGR